MTNKPHVAGDDLQTPRSIPAWSREAFVRIRLQTHPRGGFGFKMPGGYWVDEPTLRKSFGLFWRNARTLHPAGIYAAEELVCMPNWSTRPRGERIAIGRCFKYFCLHGVLPITLVNPNAPYNFRYRLNEDLDQAPTASK